MKKVAVIGTAGLPANYGGFETLVENLVSKAGSDSSELEFHVYCAKSNYQSHPDHYLCAQLHYLPIKANGISSIFYDAISIIHATIALRADRLLILGVSGAIFIPLARIVAKPKIITNVDGIEWKRNKWSGAAKSFLKISEWFAARFSHLVIADNKGISDHIESTYKIVPKVIAYGGDHAIQSRPAGAPPLNGRPYALSVCRIEPENNVHLILSAFENFRDLELIFIGNWSSSEYGNKLRQSYKHCDHLHLLDPIYASDELSRYRSNACLYVHGHSAGGTNPSLVEAMSIGLPVVAYDCIFNRHTTANTALFFADEHELLNTIKSTSRTQLALIGSKLKTIAAEKYTWKIIANEYFELLR